MWTWIANHPTLTIVLCITALGLMLYAEYRIDKARYERRRNGRLDMTKLIVTEKKKSRSNARLM